MGIALDGRACDCPRVETNGITIRYQLTFEDARIEVFDVAVEAAQPGAAPLSGADSPAWVRLNTHKCEHCPLSAETTPDCPLAVRLAPLLLRFGDVRSFEAVDLMVTTGGRTVLGKTTAQHAIGSLMGLLMATSDCPYTVFLRPMARFHLPLSSMEETCYRVVSMHALALAFRARRGETVDFDFHELFENYRQLETVNYDFSRRVRVASDEDGTRNAIVMLDALAKLVPTFLDDTLQELESLFAGHLRTP